MATQYTRGNLFDYEVSHVLGHGVNCHGLMGAGIAGEFARRFPNMREFYQAVCAAGQLQSGGILPWHGTDVVTGRSNVEVLNLATQNRPGANARYTWLQDALTLGRYYCESIGRALAIPAIGCGIGGLDEDLAFGVFEEVGSVRASRPGSVPREFDLLVVEFDG